MDLAAVTRLKDLLENAGIACFIKNDIASYLTGDIAMSGVAPELWIEDDSRLAEALVKSKKDWQSPPLCHRRRLGPARSAAKNSSRNLPPAGNAERPAPGQTNKNIQRPLTPLCLSGLPAPARFPFCVLSTPRSRPPARSPETTSRQTPRTHWRQDDIAGNSNRPH